jgi:hypothetical protein
MTSVIAPCDPPYGPGVTDDLAALMPSGAPPIALFRVLAHNPRILSRFRAGRLLDAGVLSARERELLILRACPTDATAITSGAFTSPVSPMRPVWPKPICTRPCSRPPRRRYRAANASCWQPPMNWWTRAI